MVPTLAESSVRAVLDGFDRRGVELNDRRAAAVAITIVRTATAGEQILLTRRAPKMRRHAGQWALPGGRVDEGESVIDAARRELAEEVGLDLPERAVLGLLDDYPTRSGFVMTPVVLWAGEVSAWPRAGARRLRPDPGEVAAVYGVPTEQLDIEPIFITIPESDRPVIRLPLMNRYVHAPTGAVLYQFRELMLRGRPTRVDHLEQPVFAWR